MKRINVLNILTTLSVFSLLFFFTCTYSKDFNQDLGRHLKLGSIILQTHTIPGTNLFSYTNPSYPFINHHWLAEVVFQGIYQLTHIEGLILFKSFIVVLSVVFLYYLSARESSPRAAATAIFLLSPLFLERSDIRPELLGYLYFACMLYIVFTYKRRRYLLWAIPPLLLLWVNSHITFVFGGVLTLIVLGELWSSALVKKSNTYSWHYTVLFPVIVFVAVMINPHGLYGVFYPLFIFNDYGYSIVENQNIFFLLRYTHNILLTYFLLTLPLALLSLSVLLYLKKYTYAFLLILFTILTFSQIRHLPFYTLVSIPCISIALSYISRFIPRAYFNKYVASLVLICLSLIASLVFISGIYSKTFDRQTYFGLRSFEDGKLAADFLLRHKLPSNIFNNFDIGGYAIYRLYPTYRIFVDNRPEAYPKAFLQDTYIAMQTNPELMNSVFAKNNIRTIFFAHTDQTPWALTFMETIIKQKEWKLVYLDASIMILTKGTSLPDVRNNSSYLDALITKETDYINLLKLANIFVTLAHPRAANKAFAQAHILNPDSCIIQKNLYAQTDNTLQIGEHEQIKRDHWFCF